MNAGIHRRLLESILPVLVVFTGAMPLRATGAGVRWVEPERQTDQCAAPRYLTLEPTEVLSAGEVMGQSGPFPIRFTDQLAGHASNMSGVEAAFRTRCGLLCRMAPSADVPGLEAGQSITVEGELRSGREGVLVHRLLPGSGRRSSVARKLIIEPRGAVPRLVEQPGEFSFSGCGTEDCALTVKVEVGALRELRREASGRSARAAVDESRASCSSAAAYQWAKHGMRRDVMFEGRVKEVAEVRGGWASFKASDGSRRQCRRRLLTDSGLWCLIPPDMKVAPGLRGPLFPGRRVVIAGSTRGLREGRGVMVADRLEPPESGGPAFDAWKVTMRVGDGEARSLYRPGIYTLEFPGGPVLQVTLQETRRVKGGK